ncbi:MAG: adenosine deaminase [Elusimicrobia bacterium]|nr:adenosine deaminase [Elusimicrobiota bacterium]
MTALDAFAAALPKAELHLHIEGTLEPELMFELARRNKVKLRFGSVAELKAAYAFDGLQSFLDIYYEGANVLRTERDFHDLAWAYFARVAPMNVRHAEIFFDPQTHTSRSVPYAAVISGLTQACRRAEKKLGITSKLILCFLRHLDEGSALKTLDEALPFGGIAGVGLDSSEKDRPPSLFKNVFAKARAAGLRCVAHAGEEGPPSYIAEALDLLKVERVDHGVRCLEDPELVKRLAAERMALTVCPLSNHKLRVFEALEDHNLKDLLAAGVLASVHSDDPAYFGGYVDANYRDTARALGLSAAELTTLARNSFLSSWLAGPEKDRHLAEIDRVAAS